MAARRFIAYLEELERVVRDALPKAETAPARAKSCRPAGSPPSPHTLPSSRSFSRCASIVARAAGSTPIARFG